MPGIDYRQLRQQVSMREVLALIGFQATRQRGHQLRGRCPIPRCPGASSRGFSVHLDRHIYRCFACGSHGNPLDLWAAVLRLPLHPATIDLCRTAGLPLPWLAPSATDSTARNPRPVPSRAPSRNP